MEVKFHECHRTVDAVVVWVLIRKAPDPGKICLVYVLLEVGYSVLENGGRVILVE